jgi:hypothetical protein
MILPQVHHGSPTETLLRLLLPLSDMLSFSQRLFAQDPFNFSTAQTSILMAYAAFLQISGQ